MGDAARAPDILGECARMNRNVLLRRPWLTAGLVVASLVLVSTLTVAALNLRHVRASGTGGGGGYGGYNECLYTGGDPACHFSGSVAQALFNTGGDGTNCVFTSMNVFVSENVIHNQPGTPTGAPHIFVSVFRYDNCAYTMLEDSFGYTTGFDYTHDASMESASVNATVPLTDYVTGTTRNVTLNLVWKGFGNVDSYMDNYEYQTGHTIFRSHFSADDRQAIVTGTLTDGTTSSSLGPNLARLYNAQGGTLDISR